MRQILIVDDMSSIRSLIKGIVQSLGNFDVDEASSGVSALQKMQTRRYDLLISDWNMPEMSGIELLKTIRQDESLKTTPVILLTAEVTKENIREAVSLGINGYIVKPFTPDSLITSLKKIIPKLSNS